MKLTSKDEFKLLHYKSAMHFPKKKAYAAPPFTAPTAAKKGAPMFYKPYHEDSPKLFGIQEELIGGVEEETTTTVSINPYLTILGIIAIVTTFCFCLALVLIPLVSDYRGSLTYISNGMEDNCGWSGTVLGSCGIIIALCEIVAASHTRSPSLILVVLIQASTWCMIMGVSDTGWVFHYVVLVIFLSSTMYFHYSLCSLHPFETFAYKKVNTITALNLFLFFIAFVINASLTSAEDKRFALDVTVSLEVTLMCCLTLQNLCVVRALNQYKSIYILFERHPS
jgi:hypothetical protein